jgi:hypothetical protein
MDELFAFLHGKSYVLDGIRGVFHYETCKARVPYERIVHKLSHEPDASGRRTKQYREIKRQLGDDWSTDLTDGERLCDIAVELGYKEAS